MNKRYVSTEEWYPVFILVDRELWPGCYGQPKEFTDDEIADYRRVQKEFDDWQTKLRERFGRNS